MSDQAILLGTEEIRRCLQDQNFFLSLPEFLPIKKKIETMNNAKASGCSVCKMRRIASSVSADFLHILGSISDDAKDRIKKYFGTSNILYNRYDKDTNEIRTEKL